MAWWTSWTREFVPNSTSLNQRQVRGSGSSLVSMRVQALAREWSKGLPKSTCMSKFFIEYLL